MNMSRMLFLLFLSPLLLHSQDDAIDISGFDDSAHHWYDINDENEKIVVPGEKKSQYAVTDIRHIADNILLYQHTNGGWPKNYDMRAILTQEQKKTLGEHAGDESVTTFDNGATHSQIEYLAEAYAKTKDERYKNAYVQGVRFILTAQYANGGWPQFYPDSSGYRKYITFNDGAMGGVMTVLRDIVYNEPKFSFIDEGLRKKSETAFQKGLQCIEECQIVVGHTPTVWCQQHDNVDLHPQSARKFEPAALCSQESSDLVLLLMSIPSPSKKVIDVIHHAVTWFRKIRLFGIRVETVKAPKTKFMYHTVDFDRVVTHDSTAPPIWARMYDIQTGKPLFCNRDAKPVYSLAEVDRERRTGYSWYGYEPERVLLAYPHWQKKWSPGKNVLE
jgi:PelA/Pel-15E family pectate lyase